MMRMWLTINDLQHFSLFIILPLTNPAYMLLLPDYGKAGNKAKAES
jgi:hypothetical protein